MAAFTSVNVTSSFDNRPASFTGVAQASTPYITDAQPMHASFSTSASTPAHMHQQAHMNSQVSSFRGSFGSSEVNGHGPQRSQQQQLQQQQQQQNAVDSQPQIYTAAYSGVAVYEMEVQKIAVMRRRSDSWLNATQILKVAGVDKGKRTKILEKEILTGEHEKIQGGYGKYQGTWINYERGRQFCRQYGVEDILRPLLDYDMASDGTGMPGHIDTPTKEQAMAANRKRFYNSGTDSSRMNGPGTAGGTFFQNYSPTVSNALAAVSKAAKFESPVQRPGSAQKRPGSVVRRPSQQTTQSQDAMFVGGSQQSMHSFMSENAMDTTNDVFGLSSSQPTLRGQDHINEPPRKRIRASSSHDRYSTVESGFPDGTPTEAADSFSQSHFPRDSDQGPLSYPPLLTPDDKAGEEKKLALLDLFTDATRTDFSSHTAMLHLSGQDLDIPLDTSANTALHWAATLARVPLVKLLISRGANMFRGNAAGQTPLMAAVQVNNSLDHNCFPAMLDILGPLIEIRDFTGRTVLHHIAVSSGIKGRGPSSRYYLESLLEYTVRNGGSSSNASSQQMSFDGGVGISSQQEKMKPINLVKFMSEVVNVQDKTGNTALNLAARIGNKTIINQLEEVGADFNIANFGGFRPVDFGVFPRGQGPTLPNSDNLAVSSAQAKAPSQIDQIKEEIFATTTSILTQTQSQYAAELAKKQELVDQQNAEIRDVAAEYQQEFDRFQSLKKRVQERRDLKKKIENIRRSIKEQETQLQHKQPPQAHLQMSPINLDAQILPSSTSMVDDVHQQKNNYDNPSNLTPVQQSYLSTLPTAQELRARLSAYVQNNASMQTQISTLRSRSIELEAQYRRVVSLCIGVDEGRVDSLLENLVAAVESEDGNSAGSNLEVGRVREFLRKVEGAGVSVAA